MSNLLPRLKNSIRNARVLYPLARTARFAAMVGPLRPALIRYHQTCRSNPRPASTGRSIFEGLDPAVAARRMDEDGYAPGLILPDDYVERLANCHGVPDPVTKTDPHLDHPVVAEVAHDPKLLEVARRHLGAEPILFGTLIWWSLPGPGDAHARRFHYDVADYKSLVAFFYLTDVDMDCGPHYVIRGTHKKKSLRECASIYLSDEEAERKHGGRIEAITGPKGTGFFEEQTAYHKALPPNRRRLIFVVSYCLSRRPRNPAPYRLSDPEKLQEIPVPA